MPKAAVPRYHPPFLPRRPGGLYSLRYATETPISPPAEKAWAARRPSRHNGASTPIADHGGSRPMAKVATAISRIVAASTDRRPVRSARAPMNRDPSGRNRQDVANTAKTVVKPAQPPGARTAASTVADPAKRAKSYHSTTLPTQAAIKVLR